MRDFCHPRGRSVPSDLALAEDWASILEDREASRSGGTISQARPAVARKTGVPEGKLYSLRRKRLKSVTRGILAGLGGALIDELQAELRRVQHDLEICNQIGERADSGEVQSLLASREKIRAALGLDASNEGGA